MMRHSLKSLTIQIGFSFAPPVKPSASNPTQPNPMNPHDMNALEFAAYTRLCLFLLMGGCALATASLWLSVYCDWRKSNRK